MTFLKLRPNLPIILSTGKDRVVMVWKYITGEVLAKVETP
jgi:hypothetical protein